MKRLAARAPDLSIFSSGYVIRDDSGWQITDAGRAFLTSIEVATCESAVIELEVAQPALTAEADLPPNVVRITDLAERRRQREAA
ncbi:hypothetical protein [Bradyrhizobium sp. KBS0727]|nr:hypothetical protein [Bradyrhizobium sp. KBS0727]